MYESETHETPSKDERLALPVTFAVINASISRLAPMFRQASRAAKGAALSFRQLRKVLPPDPPQEGEE